MKTKPLLLLFSFAVLCVFSCKDHRRQKEVTKILTEWIGKEILFPKDTQCFVSGINAPPELCNEWFQKEHKILLYVDSAGCTSCRLNLFEWKQLMDEADSLFQGRVGFLLYFQPQSEREIAFLFVRDQFTYPVFMDLNGSINRLNRFRPEMQYQCFLLDKDNKVVMMGNPALNPRIWELYKEQIEKTSPKSPLTPEGGTRSAETTVTADKTVHNYGSIAVGSSNHAVFTLTNTGSNPLIIYRVSADCGCTNIEWDKRPIMPGQTTTLSVNMTPDETGYFSKNIDVYCNVKEAHIRLTVKGEAAP